MKTIRPHPIYVFYDAKKWILILALPVLRTVFSHQDIVSATVSSMRDLALACLLITYSFLKWRGAQYSLGDGLTLKHGVFRKRTLRIMEEHAASIEVECTPLMWLARARRVSISTAGLRDRVDATIYMSARAVSERTAGSRRTMRYAARIFPVVILAASSSNAAIGLLTLAPALRNVGKVLGRDLSDELVGLSAQIMSLGLPLLNNVANLFVLGWCFAFVRTFMRFAGFFAEQDGRRLYLTSGLVTRRDTYIDCRRITSMDLRQTLFMRVLGVYCVSITAAGYGRGRGGRPVIIPAARKRELCDALDILLPDYPTCTTLLRPVRRSIIGRTVPAVLVTASGLFLWAYGGVLRAASVVILAGGLWWLCVRIIGSVRAGIGASTNAVSVRYSRGLALHEVHIPIEVADCIRVTRAPWQRKTCTVTLLTYSEKRHHHRVRGLPYDAVCKLVNDMLTEV